jgi:hypothetical protein
MPGNNLSSVFVAICSSVSNVRAAGSSARRHGRLSYEDRLSEISRKDTVVLVRLIEDAA